MFFAKNAENPKMFFRKNAENPKMFSNFEAMSYRGKAERIYGFKNSFYMKSHSPRVPRPK